MHTIRRTRSSAIVLGAAILLASVGAALSVPAGASNPTLPQTSAAQSAAAWLGNQIGSGGYITVPGSTSPDPSATANAVLALAAAGVDASTANAALTYLEANADSYIPADGSDGPGPLALLILDAHALGADPTDFGGTNLVDRLLATEQTSGPDAGLFGTETQLGDYDAGTYIQGLAFTALKAAGVTADATAKTWLVQQQCPDGGWALPDIATNSCTEDPNSFSGPDTNSTSLAVEGLAAQDAVTPTISAHALGFLQGAQNNDGGFGYQPTNSTDPDSTALVMQSLLALGQDPSSATYTKDGNTPVSALLSYQISSGPDTGALYFPGGGTTTGDLLATYEAVPALAGLSFPVNPPAAPYVPLTPLRICDSRAGNPSQLSGPAAQCNGPGNSGSTIAAGGTKAIRVVGSFGVPADATGVVLNVTAANPTASGWFTVYPQGAAHPTTANVNYSAGQIVPNLVEVGTGSGGGVTIYSQATSDVIVDLEGYVAPASGPSGAGLYDPLSSPARICDTRAGNPSDLSGGDAQCNGDNDAGERLPPGGTHSVQVATNNGIPAGATAAVLNVTAVDPSAAGFFTVYPEGKARPTTANLNFTAGETTSNRVMVPLSTSGATPGQITIYSQAAADLIVDVSGYFTPAGGSGTTFTAAANPVRICDTRPGNPSGLSGASAQCDAKTLGSAQTRTINVTGLAGVPAYAKAVVVNLTGVSPTQNTYLTVFPGPKLPVVSDLNLATGDIKASLAVATLSSHGTISIYNNTGSTNVVVDVLGWYS